MTGPRMPTIRGPDLGSLPGFEFEPPFGLRCSLHGSMRLARAERGIGHASAAWVCDGCTIEVTVTQDTRGDRP